ncbi:hypothetical protein NNC19_10140 [Clostridium sp. SHJSY1]|uniref:hypothetical protein n=1 Tax=Clostridium sp. SHJSY1 TaxID=2942483 RepID=UPI0028742760|nr:hypothetical protein [Clostridium sp. SHJSY1]MDS0526039.1 hypothetical protein [Clostridium sp. SHJSY1]
MNKDDYKFVTNYEENEKYLASFCELAANTFGLVEFKEWFSKGYCNENYICYSYVYNDEVVANVSDEKIAFHFMAESNKYYIEKVAKSEKVDTLFVKPIRKNLGNNIVFPNTSRT